MTDGKKITSVNLQMWFACIYSMAYKLIIIKSLDLINCGLVHMKKKNEINPYLRLEKKIYLKN